MTSVVHTRFDRQTAMGPRLLGNVGLVATQGLGKVANESTHALDTQLYWGVARSRLSLDPPM